MDAKIIAAVKAESEKTRQDMKKQIDNLKSYFEEKLREQNVEIETLKETNKSLETRIARLEEKVDENDAYERRDCIVLSGEGIPASETGENCIEVARKLIVEKLRINVLPNDVSTAHRLGKKPTAQGPDRRKIIMKLCRRDLKKDIIYACKQARPGFFVNESLTPTRNTFLFALRRMKRSGENSPVKGTATIDGRVFVWVRPHGAQRDQRICINSRTSLEKFSTDYMGKPLHEFTTELA